MAINIPPTWAEIRAWCKPSTFRCFCWASSICALPKYRSKNTHPTPALAGSYAAGFAAPRLWPVRSSCGRCKGGPSTRLSPSPYRCPLLHNAPLYNAPLYNAPLSTPLHLRLRYHATRRQLPPRTEAAGPPPASATQDTNPPPTPAPETIPRPFRPLLTVRQPPRLQVSLII